MLQASDIPHLPAILNAVTDAQHLAMREQLRAVAPAFTFAGANAKAYDYAVLSLRARAASLQQAAPL